MARTRAASYDDQRERILQQAAALFARQGYSGTSMNAVAQACGVSKAALYHYVPDKSALLLQIALTHVARLEDLVQTVLAQELPARARLEALILQFVQEYANARHEHRVLTEDIKFLSPEEQQHVVLAQRRVVDAFAEAVVELQPHLAHHSLHKAVTMLLFGMINWMFTWLRPEGPLSHQAMAPVVCDLFFGGLAAVHPPDSFSPSLTTATRR
jgi:TetR/AcrR family transcriptional regulator